MREIVIAGRRIADDTPAFVVAEIGHNHQGSVATCKELIKAAAEAGADAVKLQKRSNRDLFTSEAYEAPYHSEHAFAPTYGEHREALELGWEEYCEVREYAEHLGLVFFATAFDIPSAQFLRRLSVPCFKVASGDLTNIPLIQKIAAYGLPIILSTGGGTPEDVTRAAGAAGELAVLLQCTAAYPVSATEMNLRVIESYRQQFPDTVVGLSDHYDGIMPAPVAFALGARIFEKHFTLDHNGRGSDHRFSLEPEGLRRMVRDLHRVREALGDGCKRPYESEAAGLQKMAKSLVAARDLPAGYRLTAEDIAYRSPGGGLPPYRDGELIGRILRHDLREHEAIRLEALHV